MSVSFFVFQDGLNLTSSEMRQQLLDNRTIQNIVMDYVDNYMGMYPVACNIFLSFASLIIIYFLRLSKPFTLI